MKSYMCREKQKGKREVYCRSNGRQELRFCIRNGISQAANGVHLAVGLYGLAFVLLNFAQPPSQIFFNIHEAGILLKSMPKIFSCGFHLKLK